MARGKSSRSAATSASAAGKRPRNKKTVDLAAFDENIDSEEDDHDIDDYAEGMSDDASSEQEGLETKRIRMAREYLDKIDQVAEVSTSEDESDNENDDDDPHRAISRKLQHRRMAQEGTLQRAVAVRLGRALTERAASIHTADAPTTTTTNTTTTTMQSWVDAGAIQLCRGHDLTPTCVGMPRDGSRFVSGSKDHSVILWDAQTATKVTTLCPHWKKNKNATDRTAGQVLAVACSDDHRYVAVGARDATVRIFDVRDKNNKNSLVNTFYGHKEAVTALAFRHQSLQLFSASMDRCVRHYNLQEMLYIETLYGHQFGVTDIACHYAERPVSVGRDRTARCWKLEQDSHLIFRGGGKLPSAESVTMPRDDWFVTGHEQPGNLCLWRADKKRALATLPAAHGPDHGIVCCRSLPGSDLIVTGSNDGHLRFVHAQMGSTNAEVGLTPVGSLPLDGYVNDVAVGPKARFLVAAIGQEHRMGRWERMRKAKNRLAVVKLFDEASLGSNNESDGDNDDDESQVEAPGVSGSGDDDSDSEDASSSSDS